MELTLKWQDPEYRKEYFRKYYHAHKQLKNNRKNIDWSDPEEKKKYYQNRWQENKQEVICEVCRCITYNKKKHEKTLKHKNSLITLKKMEMLNKILDTNTQFSIQAN